MTTACKKEEKEMPTTYKNGLKFISANYEINGFMGKLYMDNKGTHILFPAATPKAVQYTGIYQHIVERDVLGRVTDDYYTCNPDPAQNCAWVMRNGVLTLVVKPGTPTN